MAEDPPAMPDGEGADQPLSAEEVETVQFNLIKEYLISTCPPILAASQADLRDALESDSQIRSTVKAFASDDRTRVLLVFKVGSNKEGDEKSQDAFAFESNITQELAKVDKLAACYVKATKLHPDSPMPHQVYLCQLHLSDNSPFQTILSYVRYCLLPYSRALDVHSGEKKDGSSMGGREKDDLGVIRAVSAKLRELEVELMRSQQIIEIPKVTLQVQMRISHLAEERKGQKLVMEDLGAEGEDPEFLNELQKCVKRWKQQISAVTAMDRDVADGSTLDEIAFWTKMRERLEDIQAQLSDPRIEYTFEVLQKNKRFFATMGFNADSGLTAAQTKVQRYTALLRDFPIKVLLAANDLDGVIQAIKEMFNSLKQIKRIEGYPLDRAIALVHTISRDITRQLRASVLSSQRLMSLPYHDFEKATKPTESLFRVWDKNLMDFYDDMRKLNKRRNESISTGIHQRHVDLDEMRLRIADVRKMRKEHYELEQVISDTLQADQFVKNKALAAIAEAYEFLRAPGLDVLDCSESGKKAWQEAISEYNQKVQDVEKELEDKIRELLSAARDDSNEMFRVCSKFNKLFVRPRIKAAIHEHQEHLIETVKQDITRLQNKFKTQYEHSEALRMSHVHDVPPVSGSIIWARQIESQLDIYMQRVEDVLGTKWHHHPEGKRLKTESEQFKKKLQPQPLFIQWLGSIRDLEFRVEDTIFRIVSTPQETRLEVNFDTRLVTLFKEVRNLSRLDPSGKLGLKVPVDIKIFATEAKEKYPLAMRLDETLRTYMLTCAHLDEKKDLAPLAAGHKKGVQTLIQKGIRYQWDREKLKEYVDRLGTAAVDFQDQVDELLSRYDIILANVQRLGTCKPSKGAFRALLTEIQAVIDFLDKQGYTNLGPWVERLDRQVEDTLAQRLREVTRFWVQALDIPVGKEKEFLDEDDEELQSKSYVNMVDFVMQQPIRHEIHIRHKVLSVEPPLESARLVLAQEFQNWLGAIADLPRLKCFWTTSQRLRVPEADPAAPGTGPEGDDESTTYRVVLTRLGTEDVRSCFDKIEELVGRARRYADTWLEYQALWDMDLDVVIHELGDDLARWEAIIVDMKRSRATVDTAETERMFGPIKIEFGAVQTKVNDKYDSWGKLLLSRFGHKCADLFEDTYKKLGVSRKTLEQTPLDFTTTKAIVASVTLLQDLKTKGEQWRKNVELFKVGEKLLQRQRYNFPDEWLWAERVEAEYKSFDQILTRKLAQMAQEKSNIEQALASEEKRLNQEIKQVEEDWKQQRPTRGDIDHAEAISVLDLFGNRVIRIDEDVERMNQAKAAMDMPVREETRLKPIKEEMNDLKEVWFALNKYWRALDELGATRFETLKTSDIRKNLGGIQEELKDMPNHMHTHGSFLSLRDTIKRYLDMNGPMVELASQVLRPKHHKMLLKELGLDCQWSELTVGLLWKQDLRKHLKAIQAIVEQAQGESALEEYLKEMAGIWEHMKMEMADYRGKCFLVRNFDPIFAQLSDHLSDLQAMKQSPFFYAFEREATDWEETLNHGQEIFDVFVDVQRRWVYLEGIFNNSIDVQQQLVYQYKRFQQFDREFVKLMREIKREPSVLYWMNKERQLLPRMQQYADTLNGIQKALAEYLEKQRAAFPRFYFVGDEDLLEIIGNAKNPVKIIRHLPKMFAGITSLKLSENGLHVHGMQSKEGEEIDFLEGINVGVANSIHDWMPKLEQQMRICLASLLAKGVGEMYRLGAKPKTEDFFAWIDRYPAQIALLAVQVQWSEEVEEHLRKGDMAGLEAVVQRVEDTLTILADRILLPSLEVDRRKKYEQLITEMVHQRDTTRSLVLKAVRTTEDYEWLSQMRFYFNPSEKDVLRQLEIRISRARFFYGFEYLGVGERLVQTPLTDRVYVTMCEAQHMRLGGNPFGPAGTGKTETVKALGNQLGRFVLVFNCDENFDFNAMGRIFIGLCQVGAWGCFDEFNRLEEVILSAVSQQILTIQNGLKSRQPQIQLLDRDVKLHENMGIFVTMNPGYAGRSNLPDNLKQLFRGIAMISPDDTLIGQVMLFSQGFRTAEDLSGKVVLLFSLCQDQLSNQSHYDFGLRALKSVLRSAGTLKRQHMADHKDEAAGKGYDWWREEEQKLLVRSMCETVVPKLVSRDVVLFSTLLSAVFPGSSLLSPSMKDLQTRITEACRERHLVPARGWMEKCMQVYQIQDIHHGVIMVGPSGTGKSSAWRCLLEAMEKLDGIKSEHYIIDPKAIDKEGLYGTLDATTLEWTDGIFTHTLRKIIGNERGEANRRHWIVFDGDVDPEWAENLNSVLDDNKLLTLPNGERLALSLNIRIMFEVKDLNHATPATVSRCGMVWFNEEVVTDAMVMTNMTKSLRSELIPMVSPGLVARWRTVQTEVVDIISRYFSIIPDSSEEDKAEGDPDSHFIQRCLDYTRDQAHIMEYGRVRVMTSMFSLLKSGIAKAITYNDDHPDFPLNTQQMERYFTKYLVFAMFWGFAGDLSLVNRLHLCKDLESMMPSSITAPDQNKAPLIDWEVRIDTQEWHLWEERVSMADLEPHKIVSADLVIDTVDTARHTEIVSSWVSDNRPLIMCGPPGSGKSMTLTAVLRAMPQCELATLNFSSTTTPSLIHHTLDHFCRVDRTPNGYVMRPHSNKRLVIFCDEINLPAEDAYKTQGVITFLRQCTEQGGFWRPHDLSFVQLERIQLIGACNPPTDAGRVAMTPRFLRFCPLLYVDYPAEASLKQIYGTFSRALLKLTPALRGHAEPLTNAMVEFYRLNQNQFTPDIQPHYIYSPRELSRWVRAMYEAMRPLESMNLEQLVRLWLHEALRLFQDRLVDKREREWVDETIDRVAHQHFPSVDARVALARPVLFSSWLIKQYVSVDQEELRVYVKERLRIFNEEELDVKLVIFDEVLEHILRIDRVLRQPLGHALLVGASGAGKTILSKFVSWMNGMSTFQIKVHSRYSDKDFDKDLRSVLTRSGTQDEKICFIFDESNVLNTAFLERMNALLASGEVPGLFENNDWKELMVACRESARRDNVMIDTEEELYQRFCALVQRNLHVVFTMNPLNEDFHNRSATSPALFNRCVIDWFGDWSSQALFQVGFEFTQDLGLDDTTERDLAEEDRKKQFFAAPGSQREAIVSTMVYVHESVHEAMQHMARQHAGRSTYVTPRHYLDFIKHYKKLTLEKRERIEDQQRHLTSGLRQLKDTEEKVRVMKAQLEEKKRELDHKEREANEKLNHMLIDQREAEQKRDASLKLGEEIKQQEAQIAVRKQKVQGDLSEAEPALRAAEAAVRGIKKSQLDELRGFRAPPALVKLAVEPIMMILGESKAKDWEAAKKVMRRADFIPLILDFKTENLKESTRQKIEAEYVANPDFDYEKIDNASKACGPLVLWLKSQLRYSQILNSVEPLTREMDQLQVKTVELQNKQDELGKMVSELDVRIGRYKEDYAKLISEAEHIKQQMEVVKVKVERSLSLITNLSSERTRWESDSKTFTDQMATVVGDCLVCGAFLAYIGYFNQSYRRMLVSKWASMLLGRKVPCKAELSVVQYMSTPTEVLEWQNHYLPRDDLCTENAIMLRSFNRYPLIIDPSGQATEFLMTHYKDKKIIRTSFLDSGFLKHLESALRFGNAILVEDVENMDPVLNSVLNREIFKTGGRVMITLGDKEIDFSPSFTIFLSTRDPTCHFTPDLCSRVTFVNFTITHSSLTTQCLSEVLTAERPDIEKKRTDLLKLQGEFRVRLRNLEDAVLNALNEVKGNILEDDTVMNTLEKLKTEATEVTEKMRKSDEIMQEVVTVTNQYRPFAVSCSRVYFTLEALADCSPLYQFSLSFFLSIVDNTLTKRRSSVKETEPATRLRALLRIMFWQVYERTSRSLLIKDQMAFAVRMAQLFLDDTPGALSATEVEFLLRAKLDVREPPALPAGLKLEKPQRLFLGMLFEQEGFKNLSAHIKANAEQWARFTDENLSLKRGGQEAKEAVVPAGWETREDAPGRVLQQLLVTNIMRPDMLKRVCSRLVAETLGAGFLEQNNNMDMKKIVLEELTSYTPLLLVSRPGYDTSGRVDSMARDLGKKLGSDYETFAMGSPEGYELAEGAVKKASKYGTWVLLKNVHLSPAWLNKLEKALHMMQPHAQFRLFMTMELNLSVPVNLLRRSHIILFEPPLGVKSSLIRTFSSLSPARVDKAPVERARIYFLLAWLHAVVLERLRYVPVGWSKAFEFSEADYVCAMDAIDEWIDNAAQGRANLPPNKIPWGALQALVETVCYGGRVDNAFDQARLEAFSRVLFVAESYKNTFPLIQVVDEKTGQLKPLLVAPDAHNYAGFRTWIERLEDTTSPEYLGLPANAELILLVQDSRHFLLQLSQLQENITEMVVDETAERVAREMGGEDDIDGDGARGGGGGAGAGGRRAARPSTGDSRPQWMQTLEKDVKGWLQRLPSLLEPLPRDQQGINDPLFRTLERECALFVSLHKTIREELSFTLRVVRQEEKPNNAIRSLIKHVLRDQIPKHWDRYTVEKMTVSLWVEDFCGRVQLFQQIHKMGPGKYGRLPFMLGGLTQPEAFYAATRQAVAQAHGWSLQELELDITVKGDSNDKENTTDSFQFEGMTLFGASWKNGALALSNEVAFRMPVVRFTWKKIDPKASSSRSSLAHIPVYLNSSRQRFLFSVKMRCPEGIPASVWSQRGTCLTVWHASI